MNSQNTADTVRDFFLTANTNEIFHPPEYTWINLLRIFTCKLNCHSNLLTLTYVVPYVTAPVGKLIAPQIKVDSSSLCKTCEFDSTI
jgi:hypothetical protein